MELVLKGEYTGTMYHVGIDVLVEEGSVWVWGHFSAHTCDFSVPEVILWGYTSMFPVLIMKFLNKKMQIIESK
jgi:hypothetical protein